MTKHHGLVGALVGLEMAAMLGCVGVDDLSEPQRVRDSIMPAAYGFFKDDRAETIIQGGWYYYNDISSTTYSFRAYSHTSDANTVENVDYENGCRSGHDAGGGVDSEACSDVDKSYCEYDWLNGWGGMTGETRYRCLSSTMRKKPVEKVCLRGLLGPGGYAGIGFELCSSEGESSGLYQFPYTLGTCPLDGQGRLLEQFAGVSFKVLEDNFHESQSSVELEVIYKERRSLPDEQTKAPPRCRVDLSNSAGNAGNGDSSRCVTNDRICNAGEHCAYIGDAAYYDGQEKKYADRAMVQAVHFQVKSDVGNMPFQFCLADVKAISNIERSTTKIDASDIVIDVPEGDPGIVPEGDPGIEPAEKNRRFEWVAARGAEVADYPDKAFKILKNEVTVEQVYSYCSLLGNCRSIVRDWESCNVYKYHMLAEEGLKVLAEEGLKEQAANCISWSTADSFCRWIGGRLPTREQWIYAARAGHENIPFPWQSNPKNDEPLDCDTAVVFGFEEGGHGCGNGGHPEKACSKPEGNTSTGLCDMLGNLWEWIDDDYADIGPEFFEPWMEGYKTIVGGGFNTTDIESLDIESGVRPEHPTEMHSPNRVGFRCVRFF